MTQTHSNDTDAMFHSLAPAETHDHSATVTSIHRHQTLRQSNM